jgi:anaerobic selenocysteine-containing dehydrogenase
MQALFDPDRLTAPVVREDAGAPGRIAEWEEALRLLRERIAPLVARGAGERIAVVDGRTPSLRTRLLEAWVHSIPGARYVPFRIESSLDRLARDHLRGEPGGRPRIDLARCGTLLVAGFELLEVDGSPVSQMRAHAERRESPRLGSAPTIYLGPRQGPTAAKADLWLPCQPGHEREVLLALAEALSRERVPHSSVLAEYARWIPEARDEVEFARRYSLENVSQRLGIKKKDLEAVVRALVDHPPSVVLPGPGLLRRVNGMVGVDAALALNLWTGGFRTEGGVSWGRDPLDAVAQELGLDRDEGRPSALMDILRPLLEIKRSPVDVLICVSANLVHELPGHDQVARALSHVPFLTCFSDHEDDTSLKAHVTFPSALSVESWDLPGPAWGTPEARLHVQRPAVVPVFDAPALEDIVLDLAGDGIAGPGFQPPSANSEALVRSAVEVIAGWKRGRLHEEGGSRPVAETSSRAVTRALLAGKASWVDESPEPRASSRGKLRESRSPVPILELAPGQLWLTLFDAPALQGGRILNRPMMMELSGLWHGLSWETWIEIRPEDAERLGIVSGDRLRVRGPRAEVTCRAVLTRSVAPGTVAAPVGFGHRALGRVAQGQGTNLLELPRTTVDDGTGTPAWGPIPVFLIKA